MLFSKITFYSLLRKRITNLFKAKHLSGIHSINYKMDKVYFRNPPNSNDLFINFRYEDESQNICKEFNLCRKLNEEVHIGLARIKNNLEKEINKKNAKKSRRSKNDSSLTETAEINIANDLQIELCASKGETFDKVTFQSIIERFSDENFYLRVTNKMFKCAYNPPWVETLSIPPVLLSRCFAYPTKLSLQYSELDYSKGIWYRTAERSNNLDKNIEWEVCGESFLYSIKDEDVGRFLKFELIPGNSKGVIGPAVQITSKSAVQKAPNVFPFERRHEYTKDKLKDDSFRVISYNLLADLYSDSEYSQNYLFPYCPNYALSMDYRSQVLLKEIIGYNGDIICLQEVDKKIFNYVLCPILGSENLRYDGVMAEKGTSSEGVATFYRKDRFELLESHLQNIGSGITNFPDFLPILNIIKSNNKLLARVSDRSTTLQLTLLKMKKYQKFVIVANTHLYFHPDADHIRLLQSGFCMKYIESYYKEALVKYNIRNEQELGIIFCGDFNSVPECGIYKLITEGSIGDDCIDWRSNKEEVVEGVSLRQPFKMRSACGTPEFTNYTELFAGCLDYIFFQHDRFSVEQIIPLPTNEELRENVAIPSVMFPSDHVALVADLKCSNEF